MRVIDSHAHVISPDRERYPFRPDFAGGPLQILSAEELLTEMDATAVDVALLVQRGQAYGFDNTYVCEMASRSGGRLVAICAADARDVRCGEAARAWFDRGARGFRVMGMPSTSDLTWLVGPGSDALWQAAAELGTPIGVHLFPSNRASGLEALCHLVARYPTVDVVVDHLANGVRPEADDHGIDAPLKALIEAPQVSLKFTAIPLAAVGNRAAEVLERYVALVGAERMMWGTDVTQSPGSYRDLVALTLAAVSGFREEQRAAMLGGTASRVYRLSAAAETV